jgi:aryl-alcohol dehydrogenase-like predicted oxidoreductase
MEIVDFGKTGLKVSRLCIGTGTHGYSGRSDQTALGVNGLASLLQQAYDRGVVFWDAADGYGSHPHIARAMRSVPRDRLVITTKTTASSVEDANRDVARFLDELGTDVLDIVLLHCMTSGDWPERYAGAMTALSQAKQLGTVRAVGVSCHALDALHRAVSSDWVDVVLARINHAGAAMDGSPQEVAPVLAELAQAGKAVYGMKILGCGQLLNDKHRAIDYVFGLGSVQAVTIGMTSPEQLIENVHLVDAITAAS